MSEPNASDCNCPWLLRAVRDESFPVVFDNDSGQYHLVLDCGERGTGHAVLRYCPWCGGSLPEAQTDRMFTQPTPADEADLHQMLKQIANVEQMHAVLGPPTDTIDGLGRNQYRYRESWESLELTVTEHKQPLTFSYGGKFRGRNAETDAGSPT